MQVGHEKISLQPMPGVISEMIKDKSMVTMECQQQLVCNLSNGATSKEPE